MKLYELFEIVPWHDLADAIKPYSIFHIELCKKAYADCLGLEHVDKGLQLIFYLYKRSNINTFLYQPSKDRYYRLNGDWREILSADVIFIDDIDPAKTLAMIIFQIAIYSIVVENRVFSGGYYYARNINHFIDA